MIAPKGIKGVVIKLSFFNKPMVQSNIKINFQSFTMKKHNAFLLDLALSYLVKS